MLLQDTFYNILYLVNIRTSLKEMITLQSTTLVVRCWCSLLSSQDREGEDTNVLSLLLWWIKSDMLPNRMCINKLLSLIPNGSQMGSLVDCGGHLNVWAGQFEMNCHNLLALLREQCQEVSGWWLKRHLVGRIKPQLSQQISRWC